MVGHDEAESLRFPVRQVLEAARPGDPVWFVDSESSDGSVEVAAGLGVEVIPAPLGKGEAMACALARCETAHICFIDADLLGSTRNIPAALRAVLDQREPDMVVAQFGWPAKRLWSNTAGIYNPLVGALFPEAVGHVGDTAFSGFRILSTGLDLDGLPGGYRAETWLNIRSAVEGWDTQVVDVGDYEGRVSAHPDLGLDVAEVILDLAEAHGRLDGALRPEWEAWVAEVHVILRHPPAKGEDPSEYTRRLVAAIERPFPPRSRAVE